jgi:hypothetical protein
LRRLCPTRSEVRTQVRAQRLGSGVGPWPLAAPRHDDDRAGGSAHHLGQFADPLIYLLIAAVAGSLVAWGFEEAEGVPYEAVVIAAILVVLRTCRAEYRDDPVTELGEQEAAIYSGIAA